MSQVQFEFVEDSLGISVMLMKSNEFLAFVGEDLVVENGTQESLFELTNEKVISVCRRRLLNGIN